MNIIQNESQKKIFFEQQFLLIKDDDKEMRFQLKRGFRSCFI